MVDGGAACLVGADDRRQIDRFAAVVVHDSAATNVMHFSSGFVRWRECESVERFVSGTHGHIGSTIRYALIVVRVRTECGSEQKGAVRVRAQVPLRIPLDTQTIVCQLHLRQESNQAPHCCVMSAAATHTHTPADGGGMRKKRSRALPAGLKSMPLSPCTNDHHVSQWQFCPQ